MARGTGRANLGLARAHRGDPQSNDQRPSQRPAPPRNPTPCGWPVEIAFLAHYGVAPRLLSAAVSEAREQGVSAEAALLATGAISESFYYQALARHLRLPFTETDPLPVARDALYPQSVRYGVVPLGTPANRRFLTAPRGIAIAQLIIDAYRGELNNSLIITTPTHFSRLLRASFRNTVARDASFALADMDPSLSAYRTEALSPHAAFVLMGLVLFLVMTLIGPPALSGFILSFAFLAVAILRLLATASAIEAKPPPRRRLADRELPLYSVVIALYREARMVPGLVAALDRFDYPRAKLDIKFVLEEDDAETCAALQKATRAAEYEIIVAPIGLPRTKPRALNVALPLLRGPLVAVFDAEDVPEPTQLRHAAECFAAAAEDIACLQARLVIDNTHQGWLPKLFAIEYAGLFDIVNRGLAALGWPFPLGGSSNHFRTDILRAVGGWDAWNVTEDADIGFRLTRFGYRAATFDAVTAEEAPADIKSFIGQRRRWCKGWYQTLGTLCRDPRALLRDVGAPQSLVMLLILFGSALAPLGAPLGIALLARTFIAGGPCWPASIADVVVATLSTALLLAGAAAILWPAFLGMKRRRILALWPSLFLLPAYYALIAFAAWTSLYELVTRPYHWCKTEHGRARWGRKSAKTKPAPAKSAGFGLPKAAPSAASLLR